MTPEVVEAAFQELQALERAAAAGWPEGYDASLVRQAARQAVDLIAAYLQGCPEDFRAALAKKFAAPFVGKKTPCGS